MSEYILILHKYPADFARFTQEQIKEIMGEFAMWRTKLIGEGKFVGGMKLMENGFKELSGDGQKVSINDHLGGETLISGLFTIRADGYDEAVRIASTCPPIKFGARIEVRETEQTP